MPDARLLAKQRDLALPDRSLLASASRLTDMINISCLGRRVVAYIDQVVSSSQLLGF